MLFHRHLYTQNNHFERPNNQERGIYLKKTISDSLIEALLNAGITRVYGIVGDSLNAVIDSIRRSKKIEWISVRHEEAAAFAAGAESSVQNSIAVCAGSSGPGNMHLINDLYDCQRNGIPVLAIAAQIPSDEIGSGYFQDTDPKSLFQECSHYCEVIDSSKQMPRVVTMALQTAFAEKGVSVLVLPGDVAALPDDNPVPEKITYSRDTSVIPLEEDLHHLVKHLGKGKRISLLCGAGCERAHQPIMELCEKLQSPMVVTLRGKECLEYNNPYFVGLNGLIGYASGYQAMMDCDVLLMLGTDFPYRQFYPTNATILQVDIEPKQLGRRADLTYGVWGDVKHTVEALLPLVSQNDDSSHLEKSVKRYQQVREDLDDLATDDKGRQPIHPQYLTKIVSDLASDDAIFTCDVGTPTVWAARYLQMNGERKLLSSFTHGSMANALPQAIGAQMTSSDRQVFSLSGDGGLSMLMGELITLKQYNLPLNVIVYNNSSLSFVELEMKASGYLEEGTDLTETNYAAVAESVGVKSIRVEDPTHLEDAVYQAIQHNGPVLLDVVVNRQELSMPPKITYEQAHGFSLWMLRAVLNGRGDEIIDVARSNLFR